MNKLCDTIILYDDIGENHLYIIRENDFFGVRDAKNTIIIPPIYFNIDVCGIMNFDMAGWGKRPYKYFFLLQNSNKNWLIYNVKTAKYLEKKFLSKRIINTIPFFKDENNDFWVLDYYTESTIPATYDAINNAFIHKHLDSKKDILFKEYADRYFMNFVSQFIHPKEQNLIRSLCYDSIEKPELIFENLYTNYLEGKYKEVLVLSEYLEKLILSKTKIDKKLESILQKTKEITSKINGKIQ